MSVEVKSAVKILITDVFNCFFFSYEVGEENKLAQNLTWQNTIRTCVPSIEGPTSSSLCHCAV